MDLYEELVATIDALHEARLDYALCGGVAVAFHGYPRFTKDIDLLVRKDDLERIVAVLGKRGFRERVGPIRFDAGTDRERESYRISKPEGHEVLTVDLLQLSPALRTVWEGREAYEWKGRRVIVVSREGLRQMKRLAGHTQDLLDLEKLGLETDKDDLSSE